MKSQKIVLYGLLSLIVVSILGYGLMQYTALTSFSSEKEGQPVVVTLKIDFAGLRPNISQIVTYNQSISVLFLLTLGRHNVSVKWYKDLAYVQAIDGIWENKNLKGYYWIYYVDGVWGDKASNLFYLGSGSVVEWKYERPNTLFS